MKIKFPEYVRLHKIITGVSEIGIWEILRDGKPLEQLLEQVPDEFFKWVKETSDTILAKYKAIEDEAINDFDDMISWSGGISNWNFETAMTLTPERRKAIAQFFMKRKNPSVLFAMLDLKDFRSIIWKMVRPHGQKTFKHDIDG